MGEGRPHYWSWDRYDRGEPGDDEAEEDDEFDDGANWKPGNASWTKSAAFPVQGVCADIGLVAIALIEERLIDAGVMGECGLVGWIYHEFLVEVEEHDVAVAKRILEEFHGRGLPMGFSRRADAGPRQSKGRPDMGRDKEEGASDR